MFKKLGKFFLSFNVFRSWRNFLLIIPLIAGVIWLNFFHYGGNIELRSANENIDDSSLIDQCNTIAKGMSINAVDNLVSSRNKRAEWTIGGLKTVKYWIVNDISSEHLPTGYICSVDLDTSNRVVEVVLLKETGY